MPKNKKKQQALESEAQEIFAAISQLQDRIACAKEGFSSATDERMIDSYIHELIALQKRYEFFLSQAKEMGLTAHQKRIG